MYIKLKSFVLLLFLLNATIATAEYREVNIQQEHQSSTVQNSTEISEENHFSSKDQLAILLSILLIATLLLYIFSLYKNNNLRAKTNRLLRKKNKELLKANQKIEASTKSKEQFLSHITHELRTPIYSITGLTHLLLQEKPTPTQQEYLASLNFSAEHLLSLVNNILDLNKLEANKGKMALTTVSLTKYLHDFYNATKGLAQQKNITFYLDVDPEIPDKLCVDTQKLSQVLLNLIGNAIKFSEGEKVWLRAKLIEKKTENVSIKFEVEDTGIGIPEYHQKKIFGKFNQGTAEAQTTYGGTGLGLFIVKDMLKLMGSNISLTSQEGKGSLFYFTLTVAIAKNQQVKNEDLNLKKLQDKAFHGKRILVAEDNKLNQKITKKIIEQRLMKCDIAENGKIAVEKALKNTYDVILMDIHMPIMNGEEASKHIKKHQKSLPILALTALDVSLETEKKYQDYFTDIIPKPYKADLLFEKLYRALQE